ncbi:MAG TPA: glycerol-3-phosphate dehydrogenase/oxidase, partial [Anaerolineales bacterium]|nr:glycerol-3-phosphate dehydrogenase/oxidase [Anaerolineales bacterium]
MWTRGWRDSIWDDLSRPWDLIVIGGGITGAGILREATLAGLRTLLVEAGDFASGTSSRSSKLVHGGLRYLRNAQIGTTLASVHERERLLREGRGLVTPLRFLIPSFRGDRLPGWLFGVGLVVYDLLALRWRHRHYEPADLLERCPPLRREGLLGGYRYIDAETDDARLVLRVLRESVRAGGTALSYARASDLLWRRDGAVAGIRLVDQVSGHAREVNAPAVINATGAWADGLRARIGGRPRLRLLRGSHLLFPATRLPLTRAVSLLHPADGRPVFVFPWEGVTVVGTTDVDHDDDLAREPRIGASESDYLLEAVAYAFPEAGLTGGDVQSTLAGVRAVVDTGQANPSNESREFILWNERGLATISGGKLTTFRLMAHSALRTVRRQLPSHPRLDTRRRVLELPPPETCVGHEVPADACLRLVGRYGEDAPHLVDAAAPGELAPIGGGVSLWAEIRWAARAEGVIHLDDLLLRRVRLGLLAPDGGLPWLERVRAIAQPELGWDAARWNAEAAAYAQRWHEAYS